ncbi:MAG: hypothetical protein R3B06_12485 [Kofleriaceae bacterium]
MKSFFLLLTSLAPYAHEWRIGSIEHCYHLAQFRHSARLGQFVNPMWFTFEVYERMASGIVIRPQARHAERLSRI